MPGIYPYAQNETLNTIKLWVSSLVLETDTSMTNLSIIIVICRLLKVSLTPTSFVIASIYLGQLTSLFVLITVILLLCCNF